MRDNGLGPRVSGQEQSEILPVNRNTEYHKPTEQALRLILGAITDPHDPMATQAVIAEMPRENFAMALAGLMSALSTVAAGFAMEAFGDDAAGTVAALIEQAIQ